MTRSFHPQRYGELLAQHCHEVISSASEYEATITLAEQLVFTVDRTTELALFQDLLVLLIAHYEDKHSPIPDSDPKEVLLHLMVDQDLKQEDLVHVMGSRKVWSDVFSKQ